VNIFKPILLLALFFLLSSVKLLAQENKDLDSISPFNTAELTNAKKHLAEQLKFNTQFIGLIVEHENTLINLGIPTGILVFDNRIEFSFSGQINSPFPVININYTYLINNRLKMSRIESRASNGTVVIENHLKIGGLTLTINWAYKNTLSSIMNDLTFIQAKLQDTYFDMATFEVKALKYRSLKEKPPLLEEQRKYVVQANTFTQLLNYYKAIELYLKVIKLNQTNYPEAYLNLALLSGQTGQFYAAIANMKKYLLLQPSLSDTKKEQDKIKEWEIMLQN